VLLDNVENQLNHSHAEFKDAYSLLKILRNEIETCFKIEIEFICLDSFRGFV